VTALRFTALLVWAVVASAAAQPRAGAPATAATLSILAGHVSHASAGAPARPALSGMNLAEGDRVVTGPDGFALVTFLDGTTVTVQPASDVVVKVAGGEPSSPVVRVLVTAGTVWARLAGLVTRRSSVSLESNAYTATARDGLIGAERRPDGTFVCWTRDGRLVVADAQGVTRATLEPGQRATLAGEGAATVEPFAVNQSVLEVTARGALPLVQMPDGARVAGFVAPGIEVNQVFGSLTAIRNGRHVVEVPAGLPGPYVIILEAVAPGRFTVSVSGRHRGDTIYRKDLGGRIERGTRVRAEVTHRLAGETEPRTARLSGGTVTPPRAHEGPLPGTIVVSPAELDAAGR
jgi:hypothetical protein